MLNKNKMERDKCRLYKKARIWMFKSKHGALERVFNEEEVPWQM